MKENKSVKLDNYEQQIVLACKGHSKLKYLDRYNQVKNVISHTIGWEADDKAIYFWLMKIIKKVDKELDWHLIDNIINNLFITSYSFPLATQCNSITIQQMNEKLISIISNFEVKEIEPKFTIMELNEYNNILNTKF